MKSSEENTAVIQMKKDFDDFLSSRDYGRQRLNFSALDNSLMDNSFKQPASLSVKSLMDNAEKAERLREAEVLAARGQIVILQTQLSSMETSNKRSRIEFERDVDTLKQDKEREMEKVEEMKVQLQFMSDKEKQTRESLLECEKEKACLKSEYEKKVLSLQRNLIKVEDDLQQVQEVSWAKTAELRNEMTSLQTELGISRAELEEAKAQLKLKSRQLTNADGKMKDLEEQRVKTLQDQQRLQDLERQLARQEEDSVITKVMKSQLERMPELEKELEKLQNENKYLRDTEKNTLILEEQADSLRKKLERTESRMADYVHLQTENEELKGRLQRWEAEDLSGSRRPQSPSELSRRVTDLQGVNAVLMEKQGQLETRIHSLEEELQQMTTKWQTTYRKLAEDKSSHQQQADFIKRLQRRLLLVSKEREGFKKILDSYEAEVTMNIGSLSKNRIEQLEETVQSYRQLAEQLEMRLSEQGDQLKSATARCMQLEAGAGTSDTPIKQRQAAATVDDDQVRQLKEKIVVLEQEVQKKEEEKNILEARIEQRHLQGDYDPTRTKIMHFTLNPAALAQRKQAEEIQNLREENKRLMERLKLLEESGGTVQDLTMRVDQNLQQPDGTQTVEELKAQLNREELRNKRLMEAFKKTSQEFREVCYQLTGYKIDIPCSNQYRLTSMYAETPKDFLLFMQRSSGEIQMLETDFSVTVKDLIEMYLRKQDSIPAFLSSITLELFSRQTMNLG